jgi:hypothetical protein
VPDLPESALKDPDLDQGARDLREIVLASSSGRPRNPSGGTK